MSSDFFETVKVNSYAVNDNAVNLDLSVKEKTLLRCIWEEVCLFLVEH